MFPLRFMHFLLWVRWWGLLRCGGGGGGGRPLHCLCSLGRCICLLFCCVVFNFLWSWSPLPSPMCFSLTVVHFVRRAQDTSRKVERKKASVQFALYTRASAKPFCFLFGDCTHIFLLFFIRFICLCYNVPHVFLWGLASDNDNSRKKQIMCSREHFANINSAFLVEAYTIQNLLAIYYRSVCSSVSVSVYAQRVCRTRITRS